MTNAAQSKPGEPDPIVQLAILVGIVVLVLNAGFYFLSQVYFDGRPDVDPARISGARRDFAIFTIVVGAAAFLAGKYPRAMAHGIAALAGLGSLVMVPFAMSLGLVLPITLLIVGGSIGLLIRFSLQRSRAAWACLAALCAVYGVVMLFGAPKIRGLFDVGMWIAMIAPGLLGVATAALRVIRGEYRAAA